MFRLFIFFYVMSGLIAFADSSQKIPIVLVGIAPYKFLVENIAGNTVDIKVVVPTGHNPHDYEMGLKDILKLKESTVWFQNNESFEHSINKFLKANKSPCQIINLHNDLNLISIDPNHPCHHSHANQFDTHTWLAPSLLKKQSLVIAKILCQTFPKHTEFYKNRLETTLIAIDHLDDQIRKILRTVPESKKTFLTNHNACGYLCRDYNLHQITINGSATEPTLQHLAALKKEIEDLSINVIFVQKQHGTKSATRLAHILKAHLVPFDPYAEDIFKNLLFIIMAIAGQ
ncbi:metal ABC transporter solute-binding protein, Zn/Mn family [Candidatus Clavichlamydia salmonicola]|uniref:metal ABC transporter solute-binding protein, Zn/Mn family n=1 Tax=Candidatus Clavichlamydia salmonicola TaxID=469812 RepID=UPI001891073C|nr:zinc ABC transporter substrate-binding protein [Candidatus Clavichlamydia salmonicola]